MIGYESTTEYDPSLRAFQYMPDRSVTELEPQVNETEHVAMDLAFEMAQIALEDGNPPVGSVLIVGDGDHLFGGKTHDKTSKKINGHAEIVAYEDAHQIVGDDLSNSTLVTTAVLCSSCTPPYAEGKIGKIITAIPRRYVWQLSGIMRPREINMHELLRDGNTDTLSVINYNLERSVGLFALYGARRGHKIPEQVDPYLEPFVERFRAA